MWWWVSMALAYEVDAWTGSQAPLADSAEVANLAFEALLDDAIARVAKRCPSSEHALLRRTARAVVKESARRVRLDRPGLSAFGNGVYSAYLEVDPLIDRVTTGREGVFSDVTVRDSLVLSLAGTASTVRFGDVRLGTDKVDHFLATGFQYLRWSHWGEAPDRAIRRGTRTERRFYGQLTSKAFSYGDLAANWDGYRFYSGLLGPDSPLQVDAEDCVSRVESWDWTAWASPAWDEAMNPSVYGERVQRAMRAYLVADREAVCAGWQAQAPVGPWEGRAPHPVGPLGLGDWCAEGVTDPRSAASSR